MYDWKYIFKYNGSTDKIQGVRFTKNGYGFNGSKIDRMYSFSKIDWQLNHHQRQKDIRPVQNESPVIKQSAGIVESVIGAATGMFDIHPQGNDFDEEAFAREMKKKRKKKGNHTASGHGIF